MRARSSAARRRGGDGGAGEEVLLPSLCDLLCTEALSRTQGRALDGLRALRKQAVNTKLLSDTQVQCALCYTARPRLRPAASLCLAQLSGDGARLSNNAAAAPSSRHALSLSGQSQDAWAATLCWVQAGKRIRALSKHPNAEIAKLAAEVGC